MVLEDRRAELIRRITDKFIFLKSNPGYLDNPQQVWQAWINHLDSTEESEQWWLTEAQRCQTQEDLDGLAHYWDPDDPLAIAT